MMLGTLEWSHSDSGLSIQVAMGHKLLGYVGCKTCSGVGYLQGTTLFVICAAQKNKYIHLENKSLISTPRKLISTAGKLIFQVREYT